MKKSKNVPLQKQKIISFTFLITIPSNWWSPDLFFTKQIFRSGLICIYKTNIQIWTCPDLSYSMKKKTIIWTLDLINFEFIWVQILPFSKEIIRSEHVQIYFIQHWFLILLIGSLWPRISSYLFIFSQSPFSENYQQFSILLVHCRDFQHI